MTKWTSSADMDASRSARRWRQDTWAYFHQVQPVIEELESYWPLTLRQIYYQLVARMVIRNNQNEYTRLSRVLGEARLKGLVSWESMEDRGRPLLRSATWRDHTSFLASEMDMFLQGYRRDLLQSQSVALEVWIEKDALSHICFDVAAEYGVLVAVARGFSSITFKHECAERIRDNLTQCKSTRILYFGDLDPSGWEMLPSMMRTLHQDMGLEGVVVGHRVALTPEQVVDLELPYSLDAMKDTDSRTPKFRSMLAEAGYPTDMAVELDALPPATLEGMVRQAIEDNLDLSLLQIERELQEAELPKIEELKLAVRNFIDSR